MLKRMLKSQKGLTLIELLVVVVILGIIAAIAIPSVGGLISNANKDAHIGNAQQMISSARLYATSAAPTATENVQLAKLVADGYIEPLVSPEGNYSETASLVEITKVDNHYVYKVTLNNGSDIISAKQAFELDRDALID